MAGNSKQYKVGLSFTADTTQAKMQIASLQRELNQLTAGTIKSNNLDFSPQIQKSLGAVAQLKAQLQSATHVETGKLDLSKFSQSLKQSGTSLSYYQRQLSELGPAGDKAFLSLANSISQAEMPLKKTTHLMESMKTSLKNTIKWQISSSAIHAFIGSIQTAFNYAQDLNESLNNIRIVTGKSTDEMAKFAEQANKAAKQLSTTTTEYTDAALIYYQQGLSEKEVIERADVTIKMANVSRQSAEIVSDQMTAVWNNFDDGSKSLEYYADVMTALGAATASSSDEIAQGLEKFSAIADTVGLSYEYATAALATVTAETRQSADVVGNSFKTIFARLQGLKQGETQDDGVTLNKYSEALQNVGISIFESNGQLKEMDNILNELGAKWETLGEAEQIALAQTVGGVRQYAQLIALMDNWDKFQTNLDTAYNATGSLDEQAQIYEESWEAASKRVKAALEGIYQSILDDDFFITMLDGLESFLKGIDLLIEGMGGLKGILPIISTLLLKMFSKDIVNGVQAMAYNIRSLTGANQEEAKNIKSEAWRLANSTTADTDTRLGLAQGESFKMTQRLQGALIENEQYMTEEEKKQYQINLDINKLLQERMEMGAAEADRTKTEKDKATLSFEKSLKGKKNEKNRQTFQEKSADYEENINNLTNKKNILKNINTEELFNNTKNAKKYRENVLKTLDEEKIPFKENLKELILNNNKKVFKEEKGLAENDLDKDIEKANSDFKNGFNNLNSKATKELDNYTNSVNNHAEALSRDSQNTKNATENTEELVKQAENAGKKLPSTTQGIMSATQAMMSFTTICNSFKSMWNAITSDDESMGWFERLTAIISSAGMALMSFSMIFNQQNLKSVGNLFNNVLLQFGMGVDATSASLMFGADASMTFGTALKTVIGPMLAVIAILSALAFAIKKVYEEIHKDEIELKKLNKELENSKKAAEEASSAYEQLKSSLDSLKDAHDTLAGLTEGTLEWKQAIVDINQQVLDLIEKYPQLAEFLENKNGALSISEEGYNKVLESQYNKAILAQEGEMFAQRKVINKNQELERKDIESNVRTSNYTLEEDTLDFMNTVQQIEKKAGKTFSDLTDEEFKKLLKDTNGRWANATDAFLEEFSENLTDRRQYLNLNQKHQNNLENLDVGLASNFLNSATVASGYDDTYKNALSFGMAKEMPELFEEITQSINKVSNTELKEAYASFNGKTLEEINQLIKDGELSIEQIKNEFIANATGVAALEKVEEQFNKKIQATGEEKTVQDIINESGAQDILTNLVAAKGDESVYNTLSETQTKALVDSLKNEDVIIALDNLLGEGFSKTLKNTIEDPEWQKAADERRYQQKLSSTASSLGVDKEALESYVSYLTESNEKLKENRELALEAAEANIKFSNAAEKVHEVLEDNEDIFAAADESSWEYHEAIGKLTKAVGGLFGLEVDSDYVKDHFDDIKKAINGDEEALRNLQETVAVDWAENFVNNVQDVESEALGLSDKVKEDLNLTQGFDADNWRRDFLQNIDDVASYLANSDDFTINVEADTNKALDDLIYLTNQAMAAGQMTEAQMKSMFSSMGYTPEVEMIPIDSKPQSTTMDGFIDIDGLPKLSYHGEATTSTTVEVPQIKDKNNDGQTSLTKISSPKMMASAAKKAPKSSGSSKDSKSMKKESERYHVIKEVIEDINHELDKLGDAKDRAFGSKKLKAINDETAALESLLAAEKQYKKEVEDYYKKDKAAIAAYGAKFDENGIITNYEDLIQQQVNKYNASKTDEAEKAYEKFKEALEQYEETHDLLQDQEKKIRDAENKIRDNILEGIQAKVDIQIEVNDDDIAFLDHLLGNLEDSAYDAAEAIAYLGQQTAANLKSNEAYIQGINDIFASQGVADAADRFISGELTAADLKEMEFTEDEVAALKEYRDGLMETTEQLQELRDTIWEEVMESLEELSEEFDEQADVVDHLSGVLDHYRNIVDIVGQEALGISDDMMKMFSDVAVDSAIDNLAISVDKLEGLREARAEQERALAQATTDEEIKRWTETIEETDKLIRDAEENMLSSWEEALEAAAKAFEETVTRAISNFEKAMSGTFGNLDALQDAFDKQKELDDLYLDDYKQIYELSKLTRDINKSIDDIDNLAGKEALRDILTEINQLQEDGVELSEYDLNFLRAKYELRLAEIALEEAQNAKSQVRMTRDSEGNWSYTYTADQENIDTATQNYEDKLYAIQELSSNYIEEMESQILGLNQAMLDEIAGLDQNATDYMEQVNRITAFYQEKMTAYNDQINNALSNNKEIYDNDWTNYSNATGYKISANEDFIDNFAETTLSMLTGFQDMESYQQAFNDAIGHPDIEDSLLGQLTAGYNEWKNRVEIVMNEAGTSTDQFGKHMEDMAIKVDETTDFAALAAEALKKDMYTVFDGIVSKVKTFEDSYGNAIDNLVQKNAALAGKLNEVFAAWSHVTSESGKALQVAKDYSQYAGKTNLEELVDLINQAGGMSSVNNTSSGSSKYVIDPSTQTGVRPTRMATGGYTGEWGPSGKWALLDEKELVLNASDTKNMLSIIGAVRDISRTIDLNTNGFGLGALVASGISSSESTLNQNVEIHAEFPNATNRGEIEAAFDNLINRASQYTNRKK